MAYSRIFREFFFFEPIVPFTNATIDLGPIVAFVKRCYILAPPKKKKKKKNLNRFRDKTKIWHILGICHRICLEYSMAYSKIFSFIYIYIYLAYSMAYSKIFSFIYIYIFIYIKRHYRCSSLSHISPLSPHQASDFYYLFIYFCSFFFSLISTPPSFFFSFSFTVPSLHT